MTRGIAEISRLGLELGGKMETFCGLSGIGDLIVTCTSTHSRNHTCGYLLGQGKTLEEAKEESKLNYVFPVWRIGHYTAGHRNRKRIH